MNDLEHEVFLTVTGQLPPVQPDDLTGPPMSEQEILAFRGAWRELARKGIKAAQTEAELDESPTPSPTPIPRALRMRLKWPVVGRHRLAGLAFATFVLIASMAGGAFLFLNGTSALARADATILAAAAENTTINPKDRGMRFHSGGAIPLKSVSFLSRDIGKPVTSGGVVHVIVQNATFPCKLSWQVSGKDIQAVVVGSKGTEIDLPSGEVTLSCTPIHTYAWFQPITLVHNDEFLGSALGTTVLKLNSGDLLRVHLDQPVPPPNSTMIRIEGEWVIVTLERPRANFELKKFLSDEWKDEHYPNTALFWAMEGSDGLARELAQFFVANRHKGRDGRFRGTMHTGLIVPSDQGHVISVFRDMGVEELVPSLTTAFEYLRRQRLLTGPSIQEEIDAAQMLIDEGLKPRERQR